MRTAIYVYMALYLIFSANILLDDFRERTPRWEIVSDLFLLPAGLAGMVFYQAGADDALLKTIWKAVGPLILAGHVASGILSTRQLLRGETDIDPAEVPPTASIIIDLVGILVLAPAVVLNFLFAYD